MIKECINKQGLECEGGKVNWTENRLTASHFHSNICKVSENGIMSEEQKRWKIPQPTNTDRSI